MKFFTQTCTWCKKRIYRNRGRINEANKFGWKPYCSQICQGKAISKKQEFRCARLNCRKVFLRTPHEIKSVKLYCSLSCAATANNSRCPKRKAAVYQCSYCRQKFKGRRIYCSKLCKDKSQTISGQEIIKKIQEFNKKHGRIPVKVEFPHYGAAQDRFGSWNKAIASAGFDPNPVMFSRRYHANDGHQCDSFAEKIIDDWFYDKGISHKRNVQYPENPKLTVDFTTERHWIEFFGLFGAIEKYDTSMKQKQKLAQKYKLPLIPLYPKDLFPINRLPEILMEK